MKLDIDAAIAANTELTAPRNGVGLVLKSGRRFRSIIDASGLTPTAKILLREDGQASSKGIPQPGSIQKRQTYANQDS